MNAPDITPRAYTPVTSRISPHACACTLADHEAIVLDLEAAGEIELALRARAMFGLPTVEERKAPWWAR